MTLHASANPPAPRGYAPLHPKDRGLVRSPQSATAAVTAFRTVLQHSLVTTFDLSVDEQLWAGFTLDAMLAPLLDLTPHTVPVAVRQEMIDGTYRRMLEQRAATGGRTVYDEGLAQPTLAEWVDLLIAPVEASYSLSVPLQAALRANLSSLLVDLGVATGANPRGATRIPASLRVPADRS